MHLAAVVVASVFRPLCWKSYLSHLTIYAFQKCKIAVRGIDNLKETGRKYKFVFISISFWPTYRAKSHQVKGIAAIYRTYLYRHIQLFHQN